MLKHVLICVTFRLDFECYYYLRLLDVFTENQPSTACHRCDQVKHSNSLNLNGKLKAGYFRSWKWPLSDILPSYSHSLHFVKLSIIFYIDCIVAIQWMQRLEGLYKCMCVCIYVCVCLCGPYLFVNSRRVVSLICNLSIHVPFCNGDLQIMFLYIVNSDWHIISWFLFNFSNYTSTGQ